MNKPASDIAFTENVKALQKRFGSRESYVKMEETGGLIKRSQKTLSVLFKRETLFI